MQHNNKQEIKPKSKKAKFKIFSDCFKKKKKEKGVSKADAWSWCSKKHQVVEKVREGKVLKDQRLSEATFLLSEGALLKINILIENF